MSQYYLYALNKCIKAIESKESPITNDSALCLSMCPPEETKKRMANTHGRDFTIAEQQDRIHVLEGADPSIINEFTNLPMKQEELLVKVYARSNDQETKQPKILRPPLILEKTVLFLVHYCLRVCGTNDPRLPNRAVTCSDVYAFVHDRFKMVHRDAIWQGEAAYNQIDVLITVHEIMCRTLILFTHYCYGETDFLSSRDKSLDKWFAELIDLYTLAVERGHEDYCSNCGEFLGYYIIYFYSLRQRAKDDHITFTANLSKAQLILQTVVAKLDEATKDRNLRLFSDALEMISCLECYDCIKLYECFQKSSPLLVILIFYGNISLIRISSCKRLFLLSKQQVIIPNLEKVLFCDTPEIPSILKDYQMKYNSTTKAISHDSKATFNNTIKHYERPVSFIQTKINSFSLEDIVLGASVEYPLNLPPSSLPLATVISQPLAPNAIALYDTRNCASLSSYFAKGMETMNMNETPIVDETPRVEEKPKVEEVSVTEVGGIPASAIPCGFTDLNHVDLNDKSTVNETPSTLNHHIESCLWNDSNTKKVNVADVFARCKENGGKSSPFIQYHFSECMDYEEEEEEKSDDEYVFSSVMSDGEMKEKMMMEEDEKKRQEYEKKRKEEDEKRKREEEEKMRKVEEKKRKEAEKKMEEEKRKREEAEKKREEAEKKRKEEERKKKILDDYKEKINQLEKKMNDFEKQQQDRLNSSDQQLSNLSKKIKSLQDKALKYHQAKLKELKKYKIEHGEKYCHIFGKPELFMKSHPHTPKRPYTFQEIEKEDKKIKLDKWNLLRPIHQNGHFLLSFGSTNELINSGFQKFLSRFEPSIQECEKKCGFFVDEINQSIYSIQMKIEEKESFHTDVRFEYHCFPMIQSIKISQDNLISLCKNFTKNIRGGSHKIECVDCPACLIKLLKKELEKVEHLVFLNGPSSYSDLLTHYQSILMNAQDMSASRQISIKIGDLLWNLVSLSTYQHFSEISINSIKGEILTSFMKLLKYKCKSQVCKQIQTDIGHSIINYASLYQYCYENDIMKEFITIRQYDFQIAVEEIRKHIVIKSEIKEEENVAEYCEDPFEVKKRDLYNSVRFESMQSKLFINRLQQAVIENELPCITIDENDLLY